MENGERHFGRGGWRAPSDLDKAIAAVRELGAVLLEARDCLSKSEAERVSASTVGELVSRCAALEAELRTWGLPMIDPAMAEWLSETLKVNRTNERSGVDREEVLRLANVVSMRRRKYMDNRVVELRDRGGANRPDREVIESVPLSVVPRITTLEAALRVSKKIKRQLLLNERIAAEAQTAKLSPTALRLLDVNRSLNEG